MPAIINFLGDIALFKRFEVFDIDPLSEVFLPDADYSIGNFEFIQPRDNRQKNFYDVEEEYKCSYNYFRTLKLDRIDAYGLANNHAMDYGKLGLKDVIEVFDSKSIGTFGVSEIGDDIPLYFKVNDISFIVIGGATSGRWSKKYWGYGPESSELRRLTTLIAQYQEQADHVIVFLHWGTELVDIPPPENIRHSKKMIDSGASAVIGHHPHVTHGMIEYNGGLIAPSLGSFIYVHEQERGYESGSYARKVSCVLNISFDEDKVISYNPFYYLYNPKTLLPEPNISDDILDKYIAEINTNVENVEMYTSRLRKVLVKREIKLLVMRFKQSPLSAIIHYIKYLRLRHLKKIIGI